MPRKSSFIIIIQNYPLQINVRFPKGFYETVEVDAKYLRNVFSTYGKIDTCEVYNRIEYAPFARMTFFDIDGPFRAYLAGRQRKIQIGSHFLIVTMVEQNSTFIDELNNECLIAIFEKLDAKEKIIIEQVCRRFKDLGPKSWNNIKVLNGYDFHPSSVVFQKYLTRSAPYLRTLRMFSSARALNVVFQKCRKIVEFDITIRDVLHYKKIPRLKEIFPMAVTYEKYERRQIERIHYLCRIIEKLPHLKRIRICGENSALFTAEPGIFASLPDTIEEVRIVSKGVHTALDNQEPIIVSQNVSRFSQMKLLELRGFRVYNSFEGWEGLHGLEHLNISKTTLDRRILDTISKFTKLLTLNVAHAKVSDRLLDLFITNNQSLEEIDIEGLRFITHDTFLLISQLPHLRSLKLSHILCGTLYEMSPMPNLEFLACWGLDDIDYALSEIVKQSKLLRYLNPQYYNLSTHFIQDALKAARARRHGDILYIRIDRNALPRLNLPDESRWPTLFRVGYCHFKNLDDYNRRGWAGVVSCRDLFTRYADNRYF